MKPIIGTTPVVKGSGNRMGYNQFVSGVKNGTIQGESVHGNRRVEMLPYDLLLSVRPSGFARDRTMVAHLFYADPENNLQLLFAVNWPSDRERMVRRVKAYLASDSYAQNRAAAERGEVSQSATGGEGELRRAISAAFSDGIAAHRVLAIAAELCSAMDARKTG